MGRDNLEGYIKREVENYGSPVDNELLWLKVQADLKKKKRRRFLWIIFFGTLMIGVVGLLGISKWMIDTDVINDPTIQSQEVKEEPVALIQNNQETPLESQKPLKSVNQIETADELSVISGKSQENGIKTTENEKYRTNEVNYYKDEIQQKNTVKYSMVEENKHSEITTIDDIIPLTTNTKLKPTSAQKLNNPGRSQLSILPLLMKDENLFFERDLLLLNRAVAPFITNKRKPQISNNLKIISYGLHFKYGNINKTLNTDLNTLEAYISERKSLETPLDVFGASLDFQMDITDKFYIQSGLNFYQIYERYNNTLNDMFLITLDDQLLMIHYFPDGSFQNTYGEGLAIDRSFIKKKIYNKYRSIDIPISIGYRMIAKKFYWNMDVGLSINIWSKGEGEIIGRKELDFLETSTTYKRRTGFNGLASTAIGYHFSDNLSIEFRPEIKYQFSSITNEESGYVHKYASALLALGMRYRL